MAVNAKAPLRLHPCWAEDLPHLAVVTRGALPRRVDVAIIGSGYTGLSAARALAQCGAAVVVLEQHTIGWGASSRNGGMLNPGLKEPAPMLFRRYGPRRGRELWEWSLAAIDHVEALIAAEQIACDFSRAGQVVLAHKPTHFDGLRDEAIWHTRELGDAAPRLFGPSELAAEIGTRAYHGGLFDPRAAGLHPAKYVAGLAAAAAHAGAILVEECEVTSIQASRLGHRLVTTLGELGAGQILLATNGYTTRLVPEARRGIFPAGSYIITTAPLAPDLCAELSPHSRMFYDTKHFLNYFRLTPDGRMLFGGRHNLSTALDLEHSARALQQRMVAVFPQLHSAPITHSWTGKLGLTFDLMPHVGRIRNGVAAGAWYAYGYGGHGVAVASYLGHQAGEIMAGMAATTPFAEIEHPRSVFTPYDRYYLPLLSAWFRYLDWVS